VAGVSIAPHTQGVAGVSQHAREATASAKGRASRYQARLSASRRPGTNPSARRKLRVQALASSGSLHAKAARTQRARVGGSSAPVHSRTRKGRARKPYARARQSPGSPPPTSHRRMTSKPGQQDAYTADNLRRLARWRQLRRTPRSLHEERGGLFDATTANDGASAASSAALDGTSALVTCPRVILRRQPA
jgi:hypothetical protein